MTKITKLCWLIGKYRSNLNIYDTYITIYVAHFVREKNQESYSHVIIFWWINKYCLWDTLHEDRFILVGSKLFRGYNRNRITVTFEQLLKFEWSFLMIQPSYNPLACHHTSFRDAQRGSNGENHEKWYFAC